MAIASTPRRVADGRRYTRADWTDFAHTGPGTLAGRYLRTFWQPIYLSEDLPAGRAVPIKVMSEDFTLYRGESGRAQVLAFRCAHRGTQLSTGWVEGDDLRCFYHGWKYGPDGQCVEQPAEPEPFCQKIRIRSYPTQEYLGLVFAYLGEGEPPPLPRYPEVENFDGIIENANFVWPCNYFNRIDNAPDRAHVTFVHRHLNIPLATLEAREASYGLETRATEPGGPVEALRFCMPNINYVANAPRYPEEEGWRLALEWRVPVDDEHYLDLHANGVQVRGDAVERFWERRKEHLERARQSPSIPELGEKVLAGLARLEDVEMLVPTRIPMQDYVSLVGQGRIIDRRNDNLGRSDVGTILLRKIWERELRAMAEGRALTRWVPPGA